MRRLILLITFLLFCKPILAEPNTTIKYLLNERVSLFDFGCYRLTNILSSDAYIREYGKINPSSINIGLAKTMDRLHIYAQGTLPQDGKRDIEVAKELCSESINRIKELLWIDPKTGQVNDVAKALNGGKAASMLGTHLFAHRGYELGNTPKEFEINLDQITVIRVVFAKNMDKSVLCESALLDKSISYSEIAR